MDNKIVNEIKSRIDIVELVGQYVALKKAGRYYKGNCPWHNEKTPSFTVSPDKGIAYCFGCQRGGDIFTFVELTEKVEFPEAMRQLAEKAGIELSPEDREIRDQKARLIVINEHAERFFSQNLQERSGAKAREYLQKRGVSEQMITEFALGYAEDSFTALLDHLKAQGFSESEAADSGLLVSGKNQGKHYDRFRDRVIFPIHSHSGKIVAFAGRSLDGSEPKYMNSPESRMYHKSELIYNFSRAKKAIQDADLVIAVEGYMDALSLYQHGFENVVATCGTAFTTTQMAKLSKLSSNIALAFDADAAGIEANKRAINTALEQGMNVSIIKLVGGKDPDEIVKSGDFQGLLDRRVSAFDFLLSESMQRYDLGIPSEKKKIAEAMLKFLAHFVSEVEREDYMRQLGKCLNISMNTLYEELTRSRIQTSAQQAQIATVSDEDGSAPSRLSPEKILLGALIEYRELARVVIPEIAMDIFVASPRALVLKVVDHHNSASEKSVVDLLDSMDRAEEVVATKLAMEAASFLQNKSETDIKAEILDIYHRVQGTAKSTRRSDLIFGLRTALQDEDKERADKILEKINLLK